jgi:hypothetical protein
MPKMIKTKYDNFDEGNKEWKKKRMEKLATLHKNEKEDNENRIISALVSEKFGLTQKELMEKTGLSDETIRTHTDNKIEEGVITRNKKNDKYQLTEYAAQNFYLQSLVFGQDAVRELVGDYPSSSLFNNNSCPTKQIAEMAEKETVFFEYTKDNKNLTKESEFLLNFAINIGSLITFVMLKAIEPSKEEDGKEKEKKSITWTKNSILSTEILTQFMTNTIVNKGKRIKKSKEKLLTSKINPTIPSPIKEEFLSRLISDKEYSQYEIDKTTYQSLEKAYKEIWPYKHIVLKNLSEPQRLSEIVKDGIKSIPKTTKAIEEIKENRENLLCFKSQQIVKIITLSYLARLNRKY